MTTVLSVVSCGREIGRWRGSLGLWVTSYHESEEYYLITFMFRTDIGGETYETNCKTYV